MSIARTLCISLILSAGALGCHHADRDRDRNEPAPGSPRVVEGHGADDTSTNPVVPGANTVTRPDVTREPGTASPAGTQESPEAYNAHAANAANGGNVSPDMAGAGTMGQVRNDDTTPMGSGPGSSKGTGSGSGSGKGSGKGSGSSAGGW
ncbi:MAG TPA: hypothetical protein VFP84_18105 [Kofleriaceae bacterium]|nr:hypothetical protein [Kofleriaceae bacterium]